nr:LysR family transcriptional regulator [uncultured Cupriavidus sp.]
MAMPREPVDSHLIRVLHLLLTERSVSRTAQLLGQTQPSISVALRRLRALTGDPLLVRSGNRMVPTEHGLALVGAAELALTGIGRILEPATDFDPAHTTRVFRIGSPDYLDVFFVPSVIERFHAQAPHATLEIHHLMAEGGYEHGLADGHLDQVVGNWRTPPDNLHLHPLCADELVCLLREEHPIRAGAMTAQAYGAAQHLTVATRNLPGHDTIDIELARAGLSRKVTTQIPYFCMAPYVLVRSNLVFTTTRAFASHYASLLPLRIEPLPVPTSALHYYQLWHARSHKDMGSRWLRGIVAAAAQDIFPATAPRRRPAAKVS